MISASSIAPPSAARKRSGEIARSRPPAASSQPSTFRSPTATVWPAYRPSEEPRNGADLDVRRSGQRTLASPKPWCHSAAASVDAVARIHAASRQSGDAAEEPLSARGAVQPGATTRIFPQRSPGSRSRCCSSRLSQISLRVGKGRTASTADERDRWLRVTSLTRQCCERRAEDHTAVLDYHQDEGATRPSASCPGRAIPGRDRAARHPSGIMTNELQPVATPRTTAVVGELLDSARLRRGRDRRAAALAGDTAHLPAVYRIFCTFLGPEPTAEDLTPETVRSYPDQLERAGRTPARSPSTSRHCASSLKRSMPTRRSAPSDRRALRGRAARLVPG